MDDFKQLDFLDILTIMSFCISLQNLELNISQDDLQKETEKLDKVLRENVEDIHQHLSVQDTKLNIIMEQLKGINERLKEWK